MFFEMNTASQTQISSEILQVLFASIINSNHKLAVRFIYNNYVYIKRYLTPLDTQLEDDETSEDEVVASISSSNNPDQNN